MVEVPVRRRGARAEDIVTERREHVKEPHVDKAAKEKAHRVVDKSADVAHKGIERAEEAIERTKEAVQPAVEKAKEIAEPAKEAAQATVRVARKRAYSFGQKIGNVVDQTTHRIEQEGRQTRNVLLRVLDFFIGSMFLPIRWAWNTNKRLWGWLPPTFGLILGTLFFIGATWFILGEVLFPLLFEDESFGFGHQGLQRGGLEEWKERLQETMRRGGRPSERYFSYYQEEEEGGEPGSPDFGTSHLSRKRQNKILQYVEHLHVDNTYRIRRDIRHLREEMLGRGGILKWTYNRLLDVSDSLGRRWRHMYIDTKYGLMNAWDTFSYYALYPFKKVEHTAEQGWDRIKEGAQRGWQNIKERTENVRDTFEEGLGHFKRDTRRAGEALKRPWQGQYRRNGQRRRPPSQYNRDQYYRDYYDTAHQRRRGSWRREPAFPEKASDVLMGGKDYLQEKAGEAIDWAKEKTGQAAGWAKEKLPSDLHEFGEMIQEAMDDLDDQYRSAKENAMDELEDLQDKIEYRKQQRYGWGPIGWLANWIW